MTPVNWKRVLLGGLLAGVVMNASEAALHGGMPGADGAALFRSLNVPDSPDPIYMISLIVMTFVLGISAVWLYAAMRPRFGAGAGTAIRAGLAVWVVAHLWSGIYLWGGFAGIIPAKMALLPIAWGLVEAPLATLAGAWLYKEQTSAPAVARSQFV